jgi:nitroimidazol reductase NimA-like FMN-containing flavoprotein (pyridoxamine 5'-phosphate oxidase superfamily)
LNDLKTYKKDLKSLFASQHTGVLATQQDGQPYTSLVAFSSSEDLKDLFFATMRATRKYANLSPDSRVSMLIDNRSNVPSDFQWAMGVTATGRAEELSDPERQTSLNAYLAKHPHLQDFVSSPGCAFLKIRVDTYYVVTRFQKVVEIHVKS